MKSDRFYKSLRGKWLVQIMVNAGKWLGSPVIIKEANKQAKIYVGRSLTLHIFCFMLIEYARIT